MTQTTSHIPKLRFSEFFGDWEEKKMKTILKKYNQGVNTTTEKVEYTDNGIPVIRSNNILNGRISFNDLKYVSKNTYDRLSTNVKPNLGDILYCNIGSALGDASIFNKTTSYLINWNVFRLQLNINYDKKFIVNILNYGKNNFLKVATHSTMPFITGKEFINVSFSFPQLPEQQKIASFLSSVDEKIESIKEKKEALEEYKKGVMQKIFKQEMRFKDENGEDFGDWEEKKLGEICDKIQDGNYGASYPKTDEFIKEGIPFLTSKAVSEGKIVTKKIDYISEEKHKSLKKAQLKLNDVLFTNRGSNVGNIGFVDISICHGNIGPQLTLLRSNVNIISPLFLRICMESYSVQKQIGSQDSGSAMNFFGINATAKFKISLPSLPEQQKIADFLSGIDEKIEKIGEELVGAEEFKKGLLQGMFV